MLKGQQVYELGIADAMFEPADFLEESLAWAAAVVNGRIEVERKTYERDRAWDRRASSAARPWPTRRCTARPRRPTARWT